MKESKINKRIYIIKWFILILFMIIIGNLIYINIFKGDYYKELLKQKTEEIIEGNSVPRGRIYDRNYNILVDNIAVKTIYYKKEKGTTAEQEIILAYKMSKIIDINYSSLTSNMIKDFYIIDKKSKANDKIYDEEWQNYKNRKITSNDIYNYKKRRITNEDLSIYDESDKKAIYIYNLMNNGYYYDEKIIKKGDIGDYEYAYIGENYEELSGFGIKEEWDRKYVYGDTLKTILGYIDNIPYENKDNYLENGYALNDRVGVSGLEYQYESLLRGEKDQYKVNDSNDLELIKEGSRGMDIVLSIDINLQLDIDNIVKKEIKKAKTMPNTKYYNHSIVIIGDPDTGELLTIAAWEIDKNNFEEISYQIVNETIQPGSIVKGASMLVGYNSGVVKIGSTEYDACIKLKETTRKCSWRNMGTVNDLEAIKYSSNVFQYKTAIKVGGGEYCYNCSANIDFSVFETYRKTFNELGLGTLTKIDLPNESVGYIGNHKDSSLIIDYAIGQYDTFTPIGISQYISTIANGGTRIAPKLLKSVHASSDTSDIGEKLYDTQVKVLNNVTTKEKYINRIREAFRAVMTGGTGSGYINFKYKPAGKTGTSESFIDTNNDGNIDTKTNSKNFIGYAPYNDPEITIAVLSPNISYPKNKSTYLYNVTYQIVKKATNTYFQNKN